MHSAQTPATATENPAGQPCVESSEGATAKTVDGLIEATTSEFELDQMLYCSLMSQPMTTEEIQDLADMASNLNRMDHITGMLMHADGVFVQLIEGPPAAIKHLWARILRDSRHMGVVQLYHRREVELRVCEGWGMHLVDRQALQAMVHDAHVEIVHGRKTAWAPAIERMDELLSHSDWGLMARELQTCA